MSVVTQRTVDQATKLRDAAATPRATALAVATATVVAGLIRFIGLAHQSLWLDEASTIAFTQRGLHGMWNLLVDYESNAFAYYLLVYPVTLVSGDLTPLRAVSAVAGVAAIPALYWAARAIIPRSALLIGCGALSLNAYAVSQSQYARAYSLILLVTIVSYGLLVRASARGGTRTHWLLYVLTTVLVVYLNSLCGFLLIVAQLIVVLPRGRGMLRRWLLAVAAVAVLAAPLAVLTLNAASGRDPFYWITRPGLFELARTQALILGGPVAAACAAVILVAAVVLARTRVPRSPAALLRHPAAPIVAWAFAPIVVLFVISLAKPVFNDQYLTPAVPGLCLALGLAVVSLPRRLGAWALALLFVSLAIGVADHARRQYFEDWRSPIRELALLRQPGDPVVFDTQVGLVPAGYYDRALTAPNGKMYVAEWHDAVKPAGVTVLGNPAAGTGVPSGPPSVALVRRLSARTGSIFLVISHADGQGDVLAAPGLEWLGAHCRMTVHRYKAVTLVIAGTCPT